MSARVVVYTTVWLILACSVAVLLAGRRDLDVLILRQPGTLFTTVTGGDVANFYTVQALNRTGRARRSRSRSWRRGRDDHPARSARRGGAYGLAESRVMLRLRPGELPGKHAVRFAVRADDGDVQTIDSSFVGPAQR